MRFEFDEFWLLDYHGITCFELEPLERRIEESPLHSIMMPRMGPWLTRYKYLYPLLSSFHPCSFHTFTDFFSSIFESFSQTFSENSHSLLVLYHHLLSEISIERKIPFVGPILSWSVSVCVDMKHPMHILCL